MGTGSFPGVKRPGRGVDHPSSSAEVKERVELYLYSPSGPLWPVLGWTLPLLYTVLKKLCHEQVRNSSTGVQGRNILQYQTSAIYRVRCFVLPASVNILTFRSSTQCFFSFPSLAIMIFPRPHPHRFLPGYIVEAVTVYFPPSPVLNLWLSTAASVSPLSSGTRVKERENHADCIVQTHMHSTRHTLRL
jgi:hypothetical protein